jgi:uncharacterized protein
MEHLDGRSFFDAFSSGAREVIENQEGLNRINVFPVPDGDTGTNLAATLSHIMGSTRVTDSAGDTLDSMSSAAIAGARGNSGAIFAQFLCGLSEGFGRGAFVTLEHFARAVATARDRAYEALSAPHEGTILSTITGWSRSLAEHVINARTFHELFDRTLPDVELSVRRTPEQLDVLKRSGVVDAGAQGFYHFVRGARDFLRTGRTGADQPATPPVIDLEAPHDVPGSAEALTYRYCTEVLADAPGGLEGLRPALEALGDSLIVVHAGSRVRVHVHTDRPDEVVELLRARGRVRQQKADDMRDQYETVHHRRHPIALVTDSACDLPRAILDEHQVHVIPLRVLFGDIEYLDRVTLTPERFGTLQRTARPYPTTSQPPSADLHRTFAWLARHYESIIAVHTSGKLSGTFAASAREAARVTGRKITVIDSRNLSGSLGLVVLAAAEAIATGRSHDEVVAGIEAALPRARILVSVRTLDYMVRGGRVSPLKGLLATVLNLKPIVSLDPEGRSLLFGKSFSVQANLSKILAMVAADHRERPLRSWAIVHAGVPEAARAFADRVRAVVGSEPRYLMEISPVVSLNSGPGAIAVVTLGS